jgi:hypothetical protein
MDATCLESKEVTCVERLTDSYVNSFNVQRIAKGFEVGLLFRVTDDAILRGR